ncbi:MAG: helix-turn-helix domain-containing protein [Lachnospiraceae bacterium]|nr:helix-turn-helix domain-containing protein [Lachnospiraceae bacterium]
MKTIYSNIPPVMTRKDLQDILKISKNTALELLQTRQIDYFMIKGRYRITREALIQFIENSSYFY